MTGVTAASFSAFYPEMVDKVVLLYAAGIMTKKDMLLTQRILSNPVIHSYVLNQPWFRNWLLRQINKLSASVRLEFQTSMKICKNPAVP